MSIGKVRYLPQPVLVEEATARIIANAVSQALAAVDCDVRDIPNIDCKLGEGISARVMELLADGRLDRLEAPLFYDMISDLAGEDNLLSQKEFNPRELNEVANTLAEMLVSDSEIVKESIYLRAEKCSEENEKLLPSDIVLACGKMDKALLAAEFMPALDYLANDMENAKALVAYYEEREQSFWNFTSASNMLGLSAYVTDDGTPFSYQDLAAARALVAELSRIDRSAEFMISEIDAGRVPDTSDQRALAFLQSPYANLICRHGYVDYGGLGDTQAPGCDHENFSGYFHDIIGTFMLYGLRDIAEGYADNSEEIMSPQQLQDVEEMLPSGAMGFLTGPFKDAADVMVSLDSLAMMAVGGLAGRLVGMTAKGVKFAAAMNALRAATGAKGALAKAALYAAPGSMLLQNAAKLSPLKRLGYAFAGLAIEAIKFNVYAAIGKGAAGDEGARAVKNAYLLFASAHAAFSAAWRARAAAEIAAPGGSEFADSLVAKGVNDPAVRRLIDDIEAPGGGRGLTEALQRRHMDLERIAAESLRQAERTKATKAALSEIEALAMKNPGVKLDRLLEEGRKIALANGEPSLARALLGRARRMVEDAKAKQTGNFRGKGPRRSAGAKPEGNGRAKKSAASDPPAAKPAAASSNPPAPTPLQRVISEPPESFSMSQLDELTGGRIRLSKGAADDIADFYAANRKMRVTFWRNVQDLHEGRQIGKKMGFNTGLYRLRVGKYRMLYRITDNGIEITEMSTRGNVWTGVKWKE